MNPLEESMLEAQYRYDCHQRRPARSRLAGALIRERDDIRPRLKKYRTSSRVVHDLHSVSTLSEFLDTGTAREKSCNAWSPYVSHFSNSPAGIPEHEPGSAAPLGTRRDKRSRALLVPLRMKASARAVTIAGRSSSAGKTGSFLKQPGKFSWTVLLSTSVRGGIINPRRSRETPRPPARLTGPVQFIVKLLEAWRLDPDKAAVLLGFDESERGHVERILSGRVPLSGRDAKDRIVHLFHVRRTLSALFQDREVENEWLREPRSLFHDKSPMDLLLEGSMENLLLLREYVETMAGR